MFSKYTTYLLAISSVTVKRPIYSDKYSSCEAVKYKTRRNIQVVSKLCSKTSLGEWSWGHLALQKNTVHLRPKQ